MMAQRKFDLWILRYLNKGRYSFVAIAHLTHENEIDHSYIGWVFSEDKLQRKLFS